MVRMAMTATACRSSSGIEMGDTIMINMNGKSCESTRIPVGRVRKAGTNISSTMGRSCGLSSCSPIRFG